MLEILKFVLSSFWIFLGTVILIGSLANLIKSTKLFDINYLWIDDEKLKRIKREGKPNNLWRTIINHYESNKKNSKNEKD